ncbi:MAG: hypothetical protein KC486_18270 [Myxococcales bacterium]|nr:hypothetical protein [Myxococcales bacterium]
MSMKVTVRFRNSSGSHILSGILVEGGEEAPASFGVAIADAGAHVLLGGIRSYHVKLDETLDADGVALVRGRVGKRVTIRFEGVRGTYRARLEAVGGQAFAEPEPEPTSFAAPEHDAEAEAAEAEAAGSLHLTSTIYGAKPLYLLKRGALAATPIGPAPTGMDALETMVTAARWVSSRRTSSFERLFPASAFHPDQPARDDRLSVAQAGALLEQLASILEAAAPGAREAPEAALDAAQLRSACVTVLAHVIATANKDPDFRGPADRAAAMIFGLIDAEQGEGSRPEIRAHAVQLLSQRGPALTDAQRERVRELLTGLRRQAPPYDELTEGPWRFALNSGYEFHKGGIEVLKKRYDFTEIEAPEDTPKPPGVFAEGYVALEAPFTGPEGQKIQIFARATSPRYENAEMEHTFFTGVAINRHANLGSADMKAALVDVRQRGYKLMLNAQCAGLTTRFAISRMFPDADIYSSWDSTYFRTGADGELSASEGIDCFVAILKGMSEGEDFAAIDARIKDAQWYHSQSRNKEFVQFIGPAHPLVSRRYEDVNSDGKADYYDGFLDLRLVEIAEDLHRSATPHDPGVAPSQISGAAAKGLGWAAGSLNRVTQYSELWDELPGQTELFYAFRSGGFYSHRVPPQDVRVGKGPAVELGLLPAVCRYLSEGENGAGIAVEVMSHSWLSHSAQELKRLLTAADAYWRAIDLGYLGESAPLDAPAGRRGGLLLTLAGLLEFPADQNMIDALWGMALEMLNLPKISRSLVRRCINEEDHDDGNYYGSRRGIRELMGAEGEPGKLEKADPVAYAALTSDDASVGRAKPIDLGGGEAPAEG